MSQAGVSRGRGAVPERVITVAQQLLMEHGSPGLTTDRVASTAGVSKATMYKHWRNRSELIVAVIERVVTPIEIPHLGNLADELRYLLAARMRQYEEPGRGDLLASVVGVSVGDAEVRDSFAAWVSSQRPEVLAMLERAARRGEVHASWDREDLMSMIAAPLFFRRVVQRAPIEPPFIESIVTMIVSAAKAGHGGKSST